MPDGGLVVYHAQGLNGIRIGSEHASGVEHELEDRPEDRVLRQLLLRGFRQVDDEHFLRQAQLEGGHALTKDRT